MHGKPWLSFSSVLWNHMESVGTKAYLAKELKLYFNQYSLFTATPLLTPYDYTALPKVITQFIPASLGWFMVIRANK
jgi:hypothetical protein